MIAQRYEMGKLLCTWSALLACLSVGGAVGCDCRGEQASVATLVERQGDVVRDTGATVGQWQDAPLGTGFRMGDGVWLRGEGRALLGLAGGQSLTMRPDSVVRFGSMAGDGRQFDVQEGEAVLVVEDTPFTLNTQFGMATFAKNSRIVIGHGDRGIQYEVEMGSARFEAPGQAQIFASVGEAVIMGPSVLDLVAAPQEATEVAGKEGASAATPAGDGAYVAEVAGEGSSVRQPEGEQFDPVAKGSHRLEVGSTLRLPPKVGATLKHGDEVVTVGGGADYELNLDGVDAQSGHVKVKTTSSAMRLRVPGGTILVEAPEGGSEVDVQITDSGTNVDVQRGQARLLFGDEDQMLKAGMTGTVPVRTAESESQDLGQPGPDQAELVTAAGRTFYVHSARMPVVVGLDVGTRCKTGAVAKLKGSVVIRGQQQVNLQLGAGRHGYQMHCIVGGSVANKVVARGTVIVLHDSGTRQLPKEAPATEVDADGRRYTVIYQNQPPHVTFRWRKAPSSPSYALTVKSRGSSRTYKDKTATHEFSSGTLGDGEHDMYYTLASGQRSRMTTIDVRFDNAAPKASVSEPPEGGFAVGDGVTISGMTLPGWKVSVEGGTINVDRQNRFTGRVQTTSAMPQITLQLSHPRKGVHYYLRHASE